MASASLVAKICSMLALGLLSLFFGLLPLRLSRHFEVDVHSSKPISALNCFGAGVILTTVFTHMMPEVIHFVAENTRRERIPDLGLPTAEIMVLLGFFLVYLMEEVTHSLVLRFHVPVNIETRNEATQMTDVIATSNGEAGAKGDSRRSSNDSHSQDEAFQGALRGFLVVFALSLHAVFEGIAVGTTARASVVWYLCFAIAAHKYVIAFCIGMRFVASGLSTILIVLYQATFALISPLGIFIGILLTELHSNKDEVSEADLQSPFVVLLQGLATGTLLYIVFFEMLEKERQRGTSGLFQILFVLLGFLVMLAVQLLEAHPSAAAAKFCELDTSFVAGLRLPINVSCSEQGLLEIAKEVRVVDNR